MPPSKRDPSWLNNSFLPWIWKINIPIAVIGALFIPMLALALLILNGRKDWVGKYRNGPGAVTVLLATLAFFGWIAWRTLAG